MSSEAGRTPVDQCIFPGLHGKARSSRMGGIQEWAAVREMGKPLSASGMALEGQPNRTEQNVAGEDSSVRRSDQVYQLRGTDREMTAEAVQG